MTDEERARAIAAQAMRRLKDEWPFQLDLIAHKAKLAKARFDALRREGFDIAHALHLCLKDVEL